MAIQTRSRSTSRGGISRGGRSASRGRQSSRTGAAVAARRSGTPAHRGRSRPGGPRGGARPRAASARSARSAAGGGSNGGDGGAGAADVDAGSEDDGGADGDDMDDISHELSEFPAIRRRFEAMQRELDIRAGVTRQLQAELDEVRAGPLGSAASDGPPEVVVTDMLPPPPRAPAMSAHLQQMAEKEDMRAWRHAANHKRWFATGRRPVEPTVPRHGMQAVLQDIVEVTPAVHGMLQDLSGFDVLQFAAPGESPGAVDIPLPDRLDILVRAVMKLISRGVPAGLHLSGDRVTALEAAFRRGLDALRRHTNEYRSLMRVPQNYSALATFVNKDVNEWAGRLYEASSEFAAQYDMPPPIGTFPDAVVPAWTRLTSYIGAGGLINSQHQLHASDRSPARRSSATLPPGKKGYCFAFASDGGCSRPAHRCSWAHAIDPAAKGGRSGSNARGSGSGNRRANGRDRNSGGNGGGNAGGSSADGGGGGGGDDGGSGGGRSGGGSGGGGGGGGAGRGRSAGN